MKLRIRVLKRSGRVELEGEEPTLGDLQVKITESLPSFGYNSDTKFSITLNGKDALTDDTQILSSYGIVSGDLICVVLSESVAASAPVPKPEPNQCDSVPQPTSHPSPPPSGCCGNSETEPSASEEHDGTETEQEPPTATSKSPVEQDSGIVADATDMEEQVGAYPDEPMLCSEAVDGEVPHSLETLFYSAACSSADDALVVVLHLLMLETGYLSKDTEMKAVAMPGKWKDAGFYKLCYTHPLCEDGSVTVACIPMGKFLVVNATLTMNNEVKSVKRLQLCSNSYICIEEQDVSDIYKDLQKLSRMFKDQLGYPLLTSARQALNLPDVFGLVVLPLEVKLRILRLLDVRSVVSLSLVCRDLHVATNDQFLWRFKYLRDFRDPISRPRDTDWKELYKVKYKQKKEALRWRHPAFLPAPIHPVPFHPGPFYPNPFPPTNPFYIPGIIGGEYDIRPQLPYASDSFNPLLPNSGQMPGRLPPLRPHFDPTAPFPDPNLTGPRRAGPNDRFSARPSRGMPIDIKRGFI
ncbi:F-box only protein 7 isoform X2 [Latimeria chalumnae]